MLYNHGNIYFIRPLFFSLIISAFLLSSLMLNHCHAQVTTDIAGDGSMGTTVTQSGNTYNITDGTLIENTNLFHSFDHFNVGNGDIASFNGPAGIANILSRVTGGVRSDIYGTLRSTIDGANLYLLNPSGVVFGPSSILDVKGSFHVSTADYLRFSDGAEFHADLSKGSTLTVAPVAAFGFLGDNPASITIDQSFLKVPTNETLSVVGGNINVNGAFLWAGSGSVNIASVDSPGEVIHNVSGDNQDLNVDSFDRLDDILLSQNARISTSSSLSGGTIVIRSGRLDVVESTIDSNNFGSVNSADVGIDIDAKQEFSADGAYLQVASVWVGRSGDINIKSDRFDVSNSTIETLTVGPGDSGDINIKSDRFDVSNFSTIGAFTDGSGNGGNIDINSKDTNTNNIIIIKEGGQISAEPYSSGNSGNLTVAADTIFMSSADNFSRPAALSTSTTRGSSGNGGDLTITSNSLEIRDGAQIDTSAFGAGISGILDMNITNEIVISGRHASGAPAGIFNRTAYGTVNAGGVIINTGSLGIHDGGTISTTSYGIGNGGDINVTADRMLLTNLDSSGQNFGDGTGIFSRGRIGKGGDMLFKVGTIEVLDGAVISGGSRRSGSGGTIEINAKNVLLSGLDSYGFRGGIFVQSDGAFATGYGGDIVVSASKSLQVKDGAQISVAALGPGDGGDLEIDAGSVLISGRNAVYMKSSRLTSSTETDAKGGNIIINTTNGLEVKGGAVIQSSTFSSGDAGSIHIDAKASNILVSGVSSGSAARIISQVSPGSSGDAGDIRIHTSGNLEVRDGSEISLTTLGIGNAGSLEITADGVILDGGTNPEFGVGLFSDTIGLGSGSAGSILINASSLNMTNSVQIATATIGTGNAGNIVVDADLIYLNGANDTTGQTGLLANTNDSGQGGNIQLISDYLEVKDGAGVYSSTSNIGDGGNIYIDTRDMLVSGKNSLGSNTVISTESFGNINGSGDAGNINILVEDNLKIQDMGEIVAKTSGPGIGGTINVKVGSLDMLAGGEVSTSSKSEGKAGSIKIEADNTFESSNGIISSSALQSEGGEINITVGQDVLFSNGNIVSTKSSGSGNAGNIAINVGNMFKSENSSVTTEAKEASGGNINVTAGHLTHLVNSEITSSVGGGSDTVGGNITMNQPYVVMDNSKIIAQANEGSGGNIQITANVFIADHNSVVSASSAKGVDGEVDIRATVKNISGNMGPLKEDYSSAHSLLLEPCAVRLSDGNQSSLVVAGRDGLPRRPGDLLPSPLYDSDMAKEDAEVAGILDIPPLAYGINFFEDKGLLPLDMMEGDTGCTTCPE